MHTAQQNGLSPELTAILPLIGVAMGAVLAGGFRFYLDRRAEHSRFRAALWMLLDDLGRMKAVLAPDEGSRGPLGTPQSPLEAEKHLIAWLNSDAWTSERSILALGLRDRADLWNALRWTMTEVDVLRGLGASDSTRALPERVIRRAATQDALARRVDQLLADLEPLSD